MQCRNIKSPYQAIFFRAGKLDPIVIRHRFRKVPFPPSTRKHENGVFKTFHSGERFQKVAFSATVFIGYVWTEAVSAAINLRFQTKTDV